MCYGVQNENSLLPQTILASIQSSSHSMVCVMHRQKKVRAAIAYVYSKTASFEPHLRTSALVCFGTTAGTIVTVFILSLKKINWITKKTLSPELRYETQQSEKMKRKKNGRKKATTMITSFCSFLYFLCKFHSIFKLRPT